jgi:penicillin-binding protein 1A
MLTRFLSRRSRHGWHAGRTGRGATTVRTLLGAVLGVVLGGGIGGAYVLRALYEQLPPIDHLADYDPMLPMRIHARDGTLLAEYGQERREVVPIDRIPLHVRQALLSIEDANFYVHHAVDYAGLLRAALRNLRAGEHAQGASTITMQVARVFFLGREKTYGRKLTEILLAYKLESVYSKDKLLELYMNQIYLGERAYGFAAAACVYFGKALDQLTMAEAAMLAGLPKAPSAYNPVANRERAVIRQRHILRRMHALGHLDAQQLQIALAQELAVQPRHKPRDDSAAFAVEQARRMMVDRFGDDAYSMGLDVVTTVSAPAQRAASRELRAGLLRAQDAGGYAGPQGHAGHAVPPGDLAALQSALAPWWDSGELRAALVVKASSSAGIDALLRDGTKVHLAPRMLSASARSALKSDAPAHRRIVPGAVVRAVQDANQRWTLGQWPRMEGALVSMDMDTGEILALAGGFDFASNQFDHAVQAVRQPGSTFKPFVYSAALEKGFFPGTLVDDTQRVVLPAVRGSKAWRPRNYGNHYEGFIAARRGLVRSKNLVAVNLMEAAGVDHVSEFAARFGFAPERNPPGLPLALGAGGTTPLQLTQAYAVFGNGGHWVQPRLVSKVSMRSGEVLYEAPARGGQRPEVISARNAHVMDSLLRDAVQHGTGRHAAALGRSDAAGKTGTSNGAKDAWFAGYSSGVASVVWMGYDQPRSLGPRATGGSLALPVWTAYMRQAVADRPPVLRAMPADLEVVADDFVYPEYLAGACVANRSPFVQPAFACPAVPMPAPADG